MTLLNDGYLHEVGSRSIQLSGRPGALLDLDRKRFCVAAIYYSTSEEVQVELFDLHGSAITHPVTLQGATVESTASGLHRELSSSNRELVAIAVGVGSLADPSDSLARTFNVPTTSAPFIAALAIRQHERTAGDRSILLALGESVESCVVTRCGPTPVAIAGDIGCLRDEAASEKQLAPALEAIRRAVTAPTSSRADRARLRAEGGVRLGRAIAPLVASLDPFDISVAGWAELVRDDFIEAFSATISQGTRSVVPLRVQIVDQSAESTLASIASLLTPLDWVTAA